MVYILAFVKKKKKENIDLSVKGKKNRKIGYLVFTNENWVIETSLTR